MKRHLPALAATLVLALGLSVAALLGMASMRASMPEHAGERAGACGSCHETPHTEGPHAELSCEPCHSTSVEVQGELEWSAMGIGDPPPHGEPAACSACHESTAEAALATEGHQSHSGMSGECGSCHTTIHGNQVVGCDSCHSDVPRHGPTFDVECTTCHQFGAAREVVGDHRELAGLSAHASIGGRVHGAMDCRGCHDPHVEEQPPPDCTSCHRGVIGDQVGMGPEGHRSCTGCHEPHAERTEAAVDCLRCHTLPQTGQPWVTVSGEVDAAMRELTRQRLTHMGRCGTCHEPHTWLASESRCTSCHEEQRDGLATMPAGSHEDCSTCHEPHAPQPTGAVCVTCHQDVHVSEGANPAEHRDCLSCHDAHAARPVARDACSSCHHDAHDETMRDSPQHRDCLSCHEQHGAPLAPTATACARCHEEPAAGLMRDAGQVPAEHVCASCHEPHEFGGAHGGGALMRCASCHQDTVRAHASHRGTCTMCHDQHEAPMGQAAGCTSCHDDIHPAVPGHAQCTDCHTPHQAGSAATRECVDCHASEVHASSDWADAGPHGGQCADCHTPHAETQRATCRSCHAEQTSVAHTGGHDSCIGCHAPHQARPREAQGSWWSRCGECHETEAHAITGALGTHGQCQTCHDPPGQPLPTCAGCHEERERPLSHGTHTSTTCSSCHPTHGPPDVVPRTTCLGCHTEQRAAHFPDAPTCTSCHPFAR